LPYFAKKASIIALFEKGVLEFAIFRDLINFREIRNRLFWQMGAESGLFFLDTSLSSSDTVMRDPSHHPLIYILPYSKAPYPPFS
jgi:hypothetical protein